MKMLLMPILTHPGHTIGLGSVSGTKIPWRVLSLALYQGLQVKRKATRSRNDAHWRQSQWTKCRTPKFNIAGWHQVNPVRQWGRTWDDGGEHETMGGTWDDGQEDDWWWRRERKKEKKNDVIKINHNVNSSPCWYARSGLALLLNQTKQ